MKCNVYDFDYTIYGGDSTLDLYRFCIKKYPLGLLSLPCACIAWFLYRLKIYSKIQFKENFYKFLKYIPDIDKLIEEFWNTHESKIQKWYHSKCKNNDIIVSASPEFLLTPICRKLEIGQLIASKVDKKTGKCLGNNCYGPEKVIRLKNEVPDIIIEEFYSDCISDVFLAKIATKSYIVRGEEIICWESFQPTRKQKLKTSFLNKRDR